MDSLSTLHHLALELTALALRPEPPTAEEIADFAKRLNLAADHLTEETKYIIKTLPRPNEK